ncbi:hypothetical protein [Roseivirga pacifica]|uniref:hypothetical protein n=1 Tax=Roseivirga pacifica TaxID=1267423 RepID=UPI00227C3C7C|nr:hypothetical protein [Roseivirga pacifica]
MKTALFILLMSITVSLHSQRIDGKYKDNFGHTLEIKSDSTFKFEWKFDLTYTWVKGEWTKEKDLLYLNNIAVYDTLVRPGQPDSLVLSIDPISSKINNEEFIESLLTSGGQKNNGLPKILKQEDERLYLVDENNRVLKQKRRGILSDRKKRTFYRKVY